MSSPSSFRFNDRPRSRASPRSPAQKRHPVTPSHSWLSPTNLISPILVLALSAFLVVHFKSPSSKPSATSSAPSSPSPPPPSPPSPQSTLTRSSWKAHVQDLATSSEASSSSPSSYTTVRALLDSTSTAALSPSLTLASSVRRSLDVLEANLDEISARRPQIADVLATIEELSDQRDQAQRLAQDKIAELERRSKILVERERRVETNLQMRLLEHVDTASTNQAQATHPVRSLTDVVSDVTSKMSAVGERLRAEVSALSSAEDARRAAQQQLFEHTSTLSRNDDEIPSLEAKISSWQSQLRELLDEIDAVSAKIERSQERVDEMDLWLEEVDRLVQLGGRMTDIQSTIQTQRQELETLKRDLERKNDRLRQDSVSTEVAEDEQNDEELLETVRAFSVHRKKSAILAAEHRLLALENLLKMQQGSSAVDTVLTNESDLTQRLRKRRAELVREVRDLTKRRDSTLIAHKEGLTNKLNNARRNLARLQQFRESGSLREAELTAERDAAAGVVAQHEQGVADLKKEVAQLEASLGLLESVQHARREFDSALQNASELNEAVAVTQRVRERQAELSHLVQDFESLAKRVTAAKEQLLNSCSQ